MARLFDRFLEGPGRLFNLPALCRAATLPDREKSQADKEAGRLQCGRDDRAHSKARARPRQGPARPRPETTACQVLTLEPPFENTHFFGLYPKEMDMRARAAIVSVFALAFGTLPQPASADPMLAD